MVSFTVQKLLSLIRSHLFIFAFVSIALGNWPKKTMVQFMSENVLAVSSRNVMVSCLKTFWVSSCVWCEGVLKLHWFTCGCPAFPILLAEETAFSHCIVLPPLAKDWLTPGVRFISGVSILFHWPMFVSVPMPHCFDSCGFIVMPEVWEGYASCFVFSRIALAILGLLWFHTHFRIICSCFMKNVIGNLVWRTLNL